MNWTVGLLFFLGMVALGQLLLLCLLLKKLGVVMKKVESYVRYIIEDSEQTSREKEAWHMENAAKEEARKERIFQEFMGNFFA